MPRRLGSLIPRSWKTDSRMKEMSSRSQQIQRRHARVYRDERSVAGHGGDRRVPLLDRQRPKLVEGEASELDARRTANAGQHPRAQQPPVQILSARREIHPCRQPGRRIFGEQNFPGSRVVPFAAGHVGLDAGQPILGFGLGLEGERRGAPLAGGGGVAGLPPAGGQLAKLPERAMRAL
jgi:hypothetical protein